jgi:hypothetical protein
MKRRGPDRALSPRRVPHQGVPRASGPTGRSPISKAANPRPVAVVTVLRALVFFDAALFIAAAVMHLGVRIPLGFTVLGFPRAILPAAIAETLIGSAFVATAVVLFTPFRWAWPVAVAAHVFALVGVLNGMIRGPQVGPDRVVHYVMLAAILAGLASLLTPLVRATFGRHDEPTNQRRYDDGTE